MKAALKAYDTEEWSDALPTLLLGFRAAFKEDLQATPAEMVYGRALRLPGEFFDPTPADESPKELTISSFRVALLLLSSHFARSVALS
ncbi:hypothetical protein JTE90_003506 [Oedothorax gibbosus]|uniref:Uncharacterized protein n=1 Tax=Oedothorax gibbosus TaxID=931172 RepID=A0AAV6TUY8_9ARAC|nr:hypothetical protein JTE90_003506 [Oedothorax gibbosus]